MFEYKYVIVELSSGMLKKSPKLDYHQAINEDAKEGWRFVQIFAPAISGYGAANHYELIFERPR
jgi:predicted metal-dependent RNase